MVYHLYDEQRKFDTPKTLYMNYNHTVQPTCIISVKCRKIRSKFYIYKMDASTQHILYSDKQTSDGSALRGVVLQRQASGKSNIFCSMSLKQHIFNKI